jgi:phosphoribosylpyrophosphate synthetase
MDRYLFRHCSAFGNANAHFPKKSHSLLDIPLCATENQKFADGEISVRISESIRGSDVTSFSLLVLP